MLQGNTTTGHHPPPPAPGFLNGVPVPLRQKQALIRFRKAEEMRPVTSRDKDLPTKEETCSEAVFSFTWGYFWAKKRQHRIVVGGRELGLGGKEPCPKGQARFSWQLGTVVGSMFPHLPPCMAPMQPTACSSLKCSSSSRSADWPPVTQRPRHESSPREVKNS